MICTVDSKGFCKRHNKVHYGHTLHIALDPSARSERIRGLWDGVRTKEIVDSVKAKAISNEIPNRKQDAKKRVELNTSHWLRPPRVALTCIHLGEHKLTNAEAKGMEATAAKLETNCRGCTGNTAMQRCTGGGGYDGYTTLSYCVTKCKIFQEKPK